MVPVECAHVVAAEVGADRGVITLFFLLSFLAGPSGKGRDGQKFLEGTLVVCHTTRRSVKTHTQTASPFHDLHKIRNRRTSALVIFFSSSLPFVHVHI